MGCAITQLSIFPQSKAERELLREAEEFRQRLIREVKARRQLQDDLESARGFSAVRTVGSSTEAPETADSFLSGSLRKGSSGSGSDLSCRRRLDVGPATSGVLAESAGLVVAVPGKVGCEDDQVVVASGDQRMLLRTRRIHRRRGGAKRSYARRHLTNLENDEELEDPSQTAVGAAAGQPPGLPDEERDLVAKVLQKHFLFANLQSAELSVLVDQMLRLEKAMGDIICIKGEKGDACYVILSGVCTVRRDAEELCQLSAGQTFGELAMLYDVPRAATIECASPRVLLTMIRGPSFRRCLARFKERTKNETLGFLNGHSVFSKLMPQEKRVFADALSPQAFEAGSALIDETVSSSADWMFLLQEGTVEITDQYRNRTVLGEGATISGQRLPYGHKALRARAVSPVRALAISGALIGRLFGSISEVLRRSTLRAFLDSVAVLRDLTDRQQMAVAALFQDHQFARGEVIVTAQADPQLVLVLEGEVAVLRDGCLRSAVAEAPIPGEAPPGAAGSRAEPAALALRRHSGQPGATSLPFSSVVCGCDPPAVEPPPPGVPKGASVVQTLHRGDVFGESTFREDCVMAHSLVAKTDAVVSRAGHDEVCQALRGYADKTQPLRSVAQRNRLKEQLWGVFPFSALYEEMLDFVIEEFGTEEFQPNAVIANRGEATGKFCMVVEGEALRRGGGQAVEPLGRWSSFGTRQLLLDEPCAEEVSAAAVGCVVRCVQRRRFAEACGAFFAELTAKMRHRELHISLDNVVTCGVLGEGQFGLVTRVLVRGVFGVEFALKRVSKRSVLELEMQQPIQLEREILSECCHPLIVRLITTFQDEHSVYFLMESLTGGDLFTAIRDIGRINEEQALFFIASVVLAIEYLHSRGIMYRDLKPENVMLQANGYLKLVDMGCCSRKARSYTFVGTPEYLAPEVILGAGYGKAADWWSVGVVAYEIICGPLPFGEGCTDPLEVFREVLEKPLAVPRGTAPEADDLLCGLLERPPEQRLGSSALQCQNEVRGHHFFEHLQWDAILGHTAVPQYVPPRKVSFSKERASLPNLPGEPCNSASEPLNSSLRSAVQRSGSDGRLDFGCYEAPADEAPEPPDPAADLSCFECF